MTVSERIRQAIESAAGPRSDISKACGVDQASICRFMAGERGLSQQAIDALATHFILELRPAGEPTARKGKATK
jgi:hypothetical protein